MTMNDAQKACEIGKLVAETCDKSLTLAELGTIVMLLWPDSKSYHDQFISAYISASSAEYLT